jgi:hypothetical protein
LTISQTAAITIILTISFRLIPVLLNAHSNVAHRIAFKKPPRWFDRLIVHTITDVSVILSLDNAFRHPLRLCSPSHCVSVIRHASIPLQLRSRLLTHHRFAGMVEFTPLTLFHYHHVRRILWDVSLTEYFQTMIPFQTDIAP